MVILKTRLFLCDHDVLRIITFSVKAFFSRFFKNITAILSFLKRERDRAVNFFHYSFPSVPGRSVLQPFTVPECSISVFDRLRPLYGQKSSETARNVQER